MRRGLSVWANACKCQALFPRKFRLSATRKRRFATLFSFDMFAEDSHVSPARKGKLASVSGAGFLASTGRGEESGDRTGSELGSGILARECCSAGAAVTEPRATAV